MKIIIEIKEGLDPERVLNYFYTRCLDEPTISQDKFKIEIEKTDLKKSHSAK